MIFSGTPSFNTVYGSTACNPFPVVSISIPETELSQMHDFSYTKHTPSDPYGKPSWYAIRRKVEDGLMELFLLDKCVPTHCQINFMAEAKILVHLTVSSIVIKEALFYM